MTTTRAGSALKRAAANTRSTGRSIGEGCIPLGPGAWRYKPPEFPKRLLDQIAPGARVKIRDVLNGREPWPLFLFGEPDAGKTCAALCIGDYVGGWFLNLPDLCSMIRQAMQRTLWRGSWLWTEYEIWKDWETASLCILDEIATRGKVSDHHYEVLKRAIDLREGRPVVFISNLDPDELRAVYDERIVRRVCRGTNVELTKASRIDQAKTGPDRWIEEKRDE